MKPLIKQTYGISSNIWKEGYFFTPSEMEEFIGEVFDKGKSTENLDNRTSGGYSYGRDIKQELIKQLLQ